MPAGGRRPGAGRPKGSKSKTTIQREEAERRALEGVPDDVTALGLMQAIYKNPELPLNVRMFAADKAAPYETPKLQAVELSGETTVRTVSEAPLSPAEWARQYADDGDEATTH